MCRTSFVSCISIQLLRLFFLVFRCSPRFRFHLGFVVSSICVHYVPRIIWHGAFQSSCCVRCVFFSFFTIIFTFILFTYIFNGPREQCAEDGLRNMFSCLVVQFCRLLHSKGKNLFNAAQFDSAVKWQQQHQPNGTQIAMNISLLFLFFVFH